MSNDTLNPTRIYTFFSAVLILVSLALSPAPSNADPFDGFFTGSQQPTSSIEEVNQLFNKINTSSNGHSKSIGLQIFEHVNLNTSILRSFSALWWPADDAERADFIEAYRASLQDHLIDLNITSITLSNVSSPRTDNFKASGHVVLAQSEDVLPVTWTLEAKQGELRIIEANTHEGSLFIPPKAKAVLAETNPSLAKLSAALAKPTSN